MTAAGRDGARHLLALGSEARPAGSGAEHRAREYARGVLEDLGFACRDEPFEYSPFPGMYGTPAVGAMLTVTLASSAAAALEHWGRMTPALLLAGGFASAGVLAARMLGEGVLRNRWLRTGGVNLMATRGGDNPRVLLVAHLDTKSQPVPSVVRIAAVIALAISMMGAGALALMLTLAGVAPRSAWWGVVMLGVPAGVVLTACVTGRASPGALDNASGVAAVLSAAAMLPADGCWGVLLTSAEELGMAGARAWAARHPRSRVLNCDGVDDGGSVYVLHNGGEIDELVQVIAKASAGERLIVRRMPLGLLTDSSAFASAGWPAVTVSRGSYGSLARVHTRGDTLEAMDGRGIDPVAHILARAAEALAT